VGTYYEARAKTSPYIEDEIEAGRHLFQAGEYDRSYELLGGVSDWPQARGRVREGLHLLEPFLAESVREAMTPDRVGGVLGTVGNACLRLGQVERSIGFYEQALIIDRAIGDRQGEGTALGNLGLAYAGLGQVERAIDFLEQSLRIGDEIKDPNIVRIASSQLERLRGGGGEARPDSGGVAAATVRNGSPQGQTK